MSDTYLTPFTAYLNRTNEKKLFDRWFRDHFDLFQASLIKDRAVRILDLGCGEGTTARLLFQALADRGQTFIYTGVEPSAQQISRFRDNLEPVWQPSVRLAQSAFEDYATQQPFDLVIAYHSLYYAPDLTAAIRRLLSLAPEVIIGHHGFRGINEIQLACRQHVIATNNIISTDVDVEQVLLKLNQAGELGRRECERYSFTATIHFRDLRHEEWHHLTAFFLNRASATVTADMRELVGDFIEDHCSSPRYELAHDVAISIITDRHIPSTRRHPV